MGKHNVECDFVSNSVHDVLLNFRKDTSIKFHLQGHIIVELLLIINEDHEYIDRILEKMKERSTVGLELGV